MIETSLLLWLDFQISVVMNHTASLRNTKWNIPDEKKSEKRGKNITSNACNLVATAGVLLSLTLLRLVVRGERRKKRRKKTIREPVSEREREKGGGERECWRFLDGKHTLIEGRQLRTTIQSTKRRGAGQVDPSASQSQKKGRKKERQI